MRFGLQLDPYPPTDTETQWQQMLAVARVAEETGFESVWYEDHFMFRDAQDPQRGKPQIECLVTLAALAASLQQVRLGMLVLGAPYRNPALLAKMLASLDVISAGRLIVGLGAGWHEQEFRAYGWPFPSIAERMDRLEEVVQIVAGMLSGQPVSFQGRYYTVEDALNEPLPVQKPRPPILIGGNGEKRTLRTVARYGDMCNVFGSPEDCVRRFEILRQHCADAGRPYEQITRTINDWALLGDAETQGADLSARFPDFPIHSPAEQIDIYHRYEDAGVQMAIVKLMDAGDLDPVRRFADQVVARL